MPDTLVSIIMPAYNAEKFIAESIESVIKQTHANWELLIVNDGSTDNTGEIIQSFCSKDLRIKYYYQDNGKQGKARNLALSHAKGSYIAFIDADDVWLEKKLSEQLADIEEKKVDLIFADGFIFTDVVSNYKIYRNSGKGYFSGENALHSFLETNKIPILTVLIKTEVLKKVKGFTEKPSIQNAEDYHLWLKLLMNGSVFYGSESILAGYRVHPDSVSYGDKLSVVQTLDVLEDLKKQCRHFKKLITSYHKKWFIKYHYSNHNWDEKQYRNLIRKNCLYLANPLCNIIFQTIYSLFGFEFTRRSINKAVNGHWPVFNKSY